MGAAHSRTGVNYKTGFLPQYHLLKLSEEDLARLYVPINLVDSCSLHPGIEVALVDCLGRTKVAVLENCAEWYYLGGGWSEFLLMIEAQKGDSVLFKFLSSRTCKLVLFSGFLGWQKYPAIEEQYQEFVLHPRQPRCFFSSSWPHTDYPAAALASGPCTMVSSTSSSASPPVNSYVSVCAGRVCNATGGPVDTVLLEFLQQLVDENELQMPLYYCKLGAFELESGFLCLDKGFSAIHISKLMDGSYRKPISIQRCNDAPVSANLFIDWKDGAYISEGWINFVRQQGALNMSECVLRFAKEGNSIKVFARLVCSYSSD